MFSRTSVCDLGKATQDLKTKVDEHTEYLWLRHCADNNVKTSELLRDFVFLTVYRKTHTRMVAEQKLHDVDRNEALARIKGLSGGPEFQPFAHSETRNG